MKPNKFNKYDNFTKGRAIFVVSLGLLQPYINVVDVEESFFLNLGEFARVKLQEDQKKYFPLMLLIIPSFMYKNKMAFCENEQTVQKLYDILGDIRTQKDYFELLDSGIDPNIIDKLSLLAAEFIEWQDSFDENYEPSLLPN
jgi:hypothetical protein